MNDDKDKKKIGGIERARKSTGIQRVDAVEEVTKVEKTKSVGKAAGTGSVRGSGQQLHYADRDKLLGMVDEEAEKLFGKSKIPEHQKKVIREAVKMAVDAATIPEEDETESKPES